MTNSTFVAVPGLSKTLTVPTNSKLYIATDGGIQTTSNSTTGFSIVDVAVSIDGNVVSSGFFHRASCANTTGVTGLTCDWSLSGVQEPGTGSHTVQVLARLAQGSNATVSGSNTSVLQGELTVLVLNT